MESSCASAPLAREPENIEAAGKARERETNASDPLTVTKARKGRETNVPCPRETESMGAREINVPEKETAAVRRDGEPLASAAMNRRQEEAAADRHQAAAWDRPPSSVREGIGPKPLSATDPGRKMRDAVGSDRPQLTAAKADRVETSRNDSRLNCEPAQLAAMKEQLASIAAQPRVLWLSTAGAETSAPAETGLVPAQVQLVPAQMQLVPAEADLVAAEADQGSAEGQLMPARMQLVPAEADLVPAEADLVPAEADQGSAEEQPAPAQMKLVPAEADLVPAEADQGSAEEQLVPTRM
jgi:hypothetical protein